MSDEVKTRKAIENKIQFKSGKKISVPGLNVPGVVLREVEITFWPNHKQRGRRRNGA